MHLSSRLERVEYDLERAERLLRAVDQSPFFKTLRWPGRMWHDWRGRLGQMLLHSPLHPWYLRMVQQATADDHYLRWIQVPDQPPPRCLNRGPLISVLLPVHNPIREWLKAAVESVRRQSYLRWELCVCDDNSHQPWVGEYCATLGDPRVKFLRSETHLGISGATNCAGTLAEGEYLALLDQDDLLAPDALAWVAATLADAPADLLYTDEDHLDESGRRVEPVFKPGWSPELLLSCMYMGHLLVVRRAAVQSAGWLRGAFDGAQDYDLALRVSEAGGVVRHLPMVLYHWRRHVDSTAGNATAKPYAQRAGRAALAEAVVRRGIAGTVEEGPFPHTYRLRRRACGSLASIVISSRRQNLLARCLRAVARCTAYPHREIVVVGHLDGGTPLATPGARLVPYTGPFDFATMNNLGARHTSGQVLVFLNDDVTPLDPGWLEALVAQAEQPEVGIVGSLLLYPNGAIQHAGIAVGIGSGTGHLQRDTFGAGYWPWWCLTREVAAVTGACLAVRRTVFDQLGGFDTRFPVNYNDADLCLRARSAGYQVICQAAAPLRHDECRTRRPGVRFAELVAWQQRWGQWVDPYYSHNLQKQGESACLR